MKCLSCSADVSPQWKHAIDNNLCPICGNIIMEETLKTLLSTLSKTIDSLKDHKDYLDDWLKIYGYVDESLIPTPVVSQPVNVVNNTSLNKENIKNSNVEEGAVIAVQPSEITNKFFKNAEADKLVSKNKNLKQLVNQIKSGNVQEANVVLDDESLDNNVETSSDIDYTEILNSSKEISTYANSNQDEDSFEDDIPSEVLALSQSGGSSKNAKDLIALKRMQEKQASARNRMLSGSGKGAFSR